MNQVRSAKCDPPASDFGAARVRRSRRLGLNAKGIWRLSNRAFKLRQALEKGSKQDPTLEPLFKRADELWAQSYGLAQERELNEAIGKDLLEGLCWTVFQPSGRSIFDRQRVVKRSPHVRYVNGAYFSIDDPKPEVKHPDDVWNDLDLELHRQPLDLVKFREHAGYVDGQYRSYLAKGGPEQEKEAT